MIKLRARGMKAAAVLAIGFLIAGVSVTAASAEGNGNGNGDGEDTTQCVPSDAVEYQAAVYRTDVDVQGWTETITGQWWNWSPNDSKGPQDYEPAFPADERGTWNGPKTEGGPDKELTGTFNASNGNSGNSSWFHRSASQVIVHATTYKQVLVTPEVLAVDAVTCPDPEPVGKVWVCKYVGTPGVDETLKQGNDGLIEVSENTLKDQEVKVGASFPDAQGRSLVVQIGGDRPDPSVCPGYVPPDVDPTVVAPEVTTSDICGVDNATLAGVANDNIVWSEVTTLEDGTLQITASLKDDSKYTFGDNPFVFTFKDSGVLCSVDDTPVVPVALTALDTCGVGNDAITGVPDDSRYGDVTVIGNMQSVTFTPGAHETLGEILPTGWTPDDEGGAVFSHTFTNVTCPIELTAVAAFVTSPPICGPNNDVVDVPASTDEVAYSDTGWVNNERTVTATAQGNHILVGTKSWTFYDEATDCGGVLNENEITPLAPTPTAICFPNNDRVTIPEDEGVTYTDTGWVNGKRTITALADGDYVLVGTTTWTFTDVPSGGCPPAVIGFAGNESGGKKLASTGVSSNTEGLLALALLLTMGGTALVVRKVRED